MKHVTHSTDSVFVAEKSRMTRLAVRGEAVDLDKYDSEGRPNPYHGWTLDFPDHIPMIDRTHSNKERAQGWYDDPENNPMVAGSKWGGTGDYADKEFHTHTQQYDQRLDPSREVMDTSGALGQYGIGEEDLNEYHEEEPYRHSDEPLPRAPAHRQHVGPSGEAPSTAGPVFGLWYGGNSYSYGDPTEHMESFPSLEHARRAVQGRYGDYDSHHGGQSLTYNQEAGTHHFVGDTGSSNVMTPAVDRNSHMNIYSARPHPNGGWSVDFEHEPIHHIWVNSDGDAVVGREHGDYGDDGDLEDDDHDGDLEDDDHDVEDQGSHPRQQQLVDAGFEHHPDEYRGDRYRHEDHNGHAHVIRAPSPRWRAMDTWHYEFHPQSEGDHDPHAPDASRDGPRSLSFQAASPEEARNLHQNLGSDLSELASRGWGFHSVRMAPGEPGDPRSGNHMGLSNHTIEAHRRHADDIGMDRLIRTRDGWAAYHVPDWTPWNRHPSVTTLADSSRSRGDVLDAVDRHDDTRELLTRP